jgi:hypothetical protein
LTIFKVNYAVYHTDKNDKMTKTHERKLAVLEKDTIQEVIDIYLQKYHPNAGIDLIDRNEYACIMLDYVELPNDEMIETVIDIWGEQ